VEISPLLFSDDFQDGNNDGWVINQGWSVKNNTDKYFFSSAQLGSAYVENGSDWMDYRYRSSFRVSQGRLLVSINLSKDGRYGLRLGADGVYLLKEQPVGTYTVLSTAGPVTTDTWHWLAFANQNGHLQVYIDQVLWFDLTDPNPLSSGTIAVGTMEKSTGGVDNITVTQITGVLPTGTPQAPAPVDPPALDPGEIAELTTSLPSEDVRTDPAAPPPAVVPPASGGQPDLEVMSFDIIPDPVQGVPSIVHFSAVNNGNAAAGAFTLLVHFHAFAGVPDCAASISALAPGEASYGQCVATSNGNTGNYPVEITADSGGTVVESNEGNNMIVTTMTLSKPVVVQPTEIPIVVSLPDLVVTGIAYDHDNNGAHLYRCSYENNGDSSTGSPVNLQAQKNGVLYQEATAEALGAGGSDFWLFPVTDEPPFTLTCIVDANGTVAEEKEGNNSLIISFP
jgi:hypothetical protein